MTEPTEEQRAVISRGAGERLAVIAGPGTGKTYCLIERCIALAAATDEPVLVLSFTRAVVGEIRHRAAGPGGVRLDASTIDGYAARIVLSAGEDLTGSFDATVRRACALLQTGASPVVPPPHVLVDEVQDLVAPRLDFVLAILERATAGFTVFGDPQQAIYDFDTKGNPSNDAFAAIRAAFPDLLELGLRMIHRERVARALAGPEGRAGSDLLRDARPMSSLGQARLALSTGRAVLLTRTNGEALALADQLAAGGLPATVRQGAEMRMAPAWIADFANFAPRSTWTRKQAAAALASSDVAQDGPRAWRTLRRVAGKDDGVSLERLRHAVARPSGHDEFAAPGGGEISTIHRAKGLEWDDVVVLEPLPEDEPSPDDERVMFVAATRARRELWRLARPDFGGRLRRGIDARWELQTWQGRPLAMEIRVGDLEGGRPFAPSGDAAAAQERLRSATVGQPADLVLDGDRYRVLVDGTQCGETTADLVDAARRRWSTAPARLTGGRVLTTRTSAGDPSAGERVGLPPTGLWLGLELVGLARPEKRAATR